MYGYGFFPVLFYRIKDIKCSEVHRKRQHFLPLKNALANARNSSIFLSTYVKAVS
jgi:hypothetical protein